MTPSLKPIRLTPDQQFLARLQLAVDLRRQGYYDMARVIAMELAQARPQEASVWHTLGQIWTDIGEFDVALQCCEESYRLLKLHGEVTTHAMQFQAVALALAQARMRYGRFDEAMDLWEAGRLNVSWSPWPGSAYYDAGHDSLLVQCEGGYGDLFMFMRWLPLLKQRNGVSKLGLCIWPSLIDFCDWSALDVDKVYQIGIDKIPFGKWQYATSIMSMPAVFGVRSWSDIPPTAIERMRGAWSPSKPCYNNTFRIGFCWRAEENSSPVRTKSLPVEVAEEITDGIRIAHIDRKTGMVRIVDVLSLSPQRADLYNQDEFQEPRNITTELDRMTSWRATAEYICSMDFVLTVDTAVAHLCGLLGVPTLILLPRSSCWRWGVPGNVWNRLQKITSENENEPVALNSTGWYGPQMTVYRQPKALEWDGEAIVQELMSRLNQTQTQPRVNTQDLADRWG